MDTNGLNETIEVSHISYAAQVVRYIGHWLLSWTWDEVARSAGHVETNWSSPSVFGQTFPNKLWSVPLYHSQAPANV